MQVRQRWWSRGHQTASYSGTSFNCFCNQWQLFTRKMGRTCCVPNCTSGYRSNKEKVSLFTIPKNSFAAWNSIIPRKDRDLKLSDFVCEKHFNSRFVIRELKTKAYAIPLKKPRLAVNAIPTIFPNCSVCKERQKAPKLQEDPPQKVNRESGDVPKNPLSHELPRMVVSCCAYGCKERFKKQCGVSFHKFPKNEIQKQKWVSAISRDNFQPTEQVAICGKHFVQTDYVQHFGLRRLKNDAVPSIFDFSLISAKVADRKKSAKKKYRSPSPQFECKIEIEEHDVLTDLDRLSEKVIIKSEPECSKGLNDLDQLDHDVIMKCEPKDTFFDIDRNIEDNHVNMENFTRECKLETEQLKLEDSPIYRLPSLQVCEKSEEIVGNNSTAKK